MSLRLAISNRSLTILSVLVDVFHDVVGGSVWGEPSFWERSFLEKPYMEMLNKSGA
jgi:hypothetical protein